ncbi:MAG TPA: phosphatase PAP2 family protein [bacterium]|nr:phosphatase PAP2 family protein [bacterium]
MSLTKKQTLWMLLLFAGLWILALAIWQQSELDRRIVFAHEALRQHTSLILFLSLVSRYGMGAIFVVTLAYLLPFTRPAFRKSRTIYLLMFLAFVLSGLSSEGLKMLIGRSRPFIAYSGQIEPVTRPITYSFPSSHATESTALILPFLVFVRKESRSAFLLKLVLVTVALTVCYSRIALGVHFLSDVLAGVGVALVCFPAAVWATHAAMARWRWKKTRL